MSVRTIKAGSTNQSINIRIVDSTDGTPETGVTSATGGLDLWYRREGAASTDITESDLSALTDAHSDGGMLHINDGWYRIDYPDAAFADGVVGVQIGGTVTGMVVLAPYVELVDFDPYDSVRLGLTALPNAAADAAGGLPISDAGGLDLDAMNTNINDIETDTNSLNDTKIPDTISLANINAEVDTAFTTQMADSVATDGAIATREQALYMILQMLTEFAISSTTLTVKKVDGSTTLMTFTLDDDTSPTSITRAS